MLKNPRLAVTSDSRMSLNMSCWIRLLYSLLDFMLLLSLRDLKASRGFGGDRYITS